MTQPQSPDSTTPPPSPPPGDLTAELPGFKTPPTRRPTTDPLDPAVTTVSPSQPQSQSPSPSAPAGEWDDLDDGGDLDERPTLSSMTDPRIGPRQVVTADPRAFEGLFKVGVALSSELVHTKVAPDHPSLWLADQEDLDAIGSPLSRIVARHVPLATGQQASDVADGLEAAVGTVGYVLKNRQRHAEWRAAGQPTIELVRHQEVDL